MQLRVDFPAPQHPVSGNTLENLTPEQVTTLKTQLVAYMQMLNLVSRFDVDFAKFMLFACFVQSSIHIIKFEYIKEMNLDVWKYQSFSLLCTPMYTSNVEDGNFKQKNFRQNLCSGLGRVYRNNFVGLESAWRISFDIFSTM